MRIKSGLFTAASMQRSRHHKFTSGQSGQRILHPVSRTIRGAVTLDQYETNPASQIYFQSGADPASRLRDIGDVKIAGIQGVGSLPE